MKLLYTTSDSIVRVFCPGPVPSLKQGEAIHTLTAADEALLAANKGAKFKVENGALAIAGVTSAPVPASVPLWAFRQILADDGLLATVQSAAASNPAVLNYLEYGNFVDRKSPTLATLAAQLGKTDVEVDDLFRRAARLKL